MATPIRQPRPQLARSELGVTNPRRVGATLYEDFLPQLNGRKAAGVYREMAENDATIGAILFAVEQLVRQVDWSVESDDDATKDFLEQNLEDLPVGWNDFIAAALSEITYGWSLFEIVYAMRDGKVWWDKFGFRTQSSLHEWKLTDTGELEAFVQALAGGQTVAIPAEKCIHFRTSTAEGRPEGRSWLRRAYRSWHIKRRVEEYSAIGVSRDLNGVPLGRLPADALLAGSGNAEYDVMKELVTGLKVDELAGVMLPSDRDEAGNFIFDLELLSTSGRPKIDSLAMVRMLAMDIASVMLAQFIGLGRDTVGSRALAEPQQEMFQTALSALLDSIEEQFHRQATERLLAINGLESGRIVHGEIRDLDLEGISQFILNVAQAGGEWFPPDGTGMDEFREMAGLQPQDAVQIEDENTDEGTYVATPGAAPPETQ